MTARDPEAGTALLEMMVALAVMALIAVTIASTFDFYGRALGTVGRLDGLAKAGEDRETVRRWAEAIPFVAPVDIPDGGFVGRPEALRFAMIPPDGPFWPGDYTEVEIAAARQADGRTALVATAVGTRPDREDRLTMRAVLVEDLRSVTFSYYGRRGSPREAWHREWAETEVPDLVRIEARGEASGREGPMIPLVLQPALIERQEVMSLSSLVPPARPSRP